MKSGEKAHYALILVNVYMDGLQKLKQHIFHLPSPFNARNDLTFVTPERNILLIDIPVTCLQLLQQFAFGHFAVTFQTVCPHIIAQNSGDQ